MSARILVPYGDDMKLFARLRDAHPEVRWDKAAKAFSFPDTPVAKSIVESLGAKHEEAKRREEAEDDFAPAPSPIVVPPWVRDHVIPETLTPYSHQSEGFEQLLTQRRWMLAWEPGVGKTLPACAAIEVLTLVRGECPKVLVACPTVALSTWQRELAKFHIGPLMLLGSSDKRAKLFTGLAKKAFVALTTIDLLRMDDEDWCRVKPDLFCIDESHRIKTHNSKTGKAARRIAASNPEMRKWLLTGTPAPNGNLDWFGQLLFLGPEYAGTAYFTHFRRKYALLGAEIVPGVPKVLGAKNEEDLARRVAACAWRLKKDDCLDLPPKVFRPVEVTLSPAARKAYAAMKEEAYVNLEKMGEVTAQNILTELMRLVQIAGGWVKTDDGEIVPVAEAVPAKLEALLDLVEDREGQPVIVWCQFVHEARGVAQALTKAGFGPVGLHVGEMPPEARQEARDGFTAGALKILVATTPSLKESATLVNCSTAIYYSRSFNLGDYLQSQDRIHRIGQTRKVEIINLIAAGTVDAKIEAALAGKTQMQESVFKLADWRDYFG